MAAKDHGLGRRDCPLEPAVGGLLSLNRYVSFDLASIVQSAYRHRNRSDGKQQD